jgi:putative sigma-54 modulation protein
MAQKLEIFGREFELTDHIRDYATKKVSKFERLLGTIEDTRVDLAYVKAARSATDRYVAQLTVRGKGFMLRSEERADDVRTAIDEAVDKLSRQITRFKGKHFKGRRDGKSATDVIPEIEETAEEPEETPVIARRKKLDVFPADEIGAIEQMKMLGHDNFFIFESATSGLVNVLYRRRDGTYGLIELNER